MSGYFRINNRVPAARRSTLLHVLVLVAVMVFGAARVGASTNVQLSQPCGTSAHSDRATQHLLNAPAQLSCIGAPPVTVERVTTAYYDGLNIKSSASSPLQFRHTTYQVNDEKIWVRYADGVVAASPTNFAQATPFLSPISVVFELPRRDATIIGLLIVARDLQHPRGIAENASVVSYDIANRQDFIIIMIFALMIGAATSLLVYNASLYYVLRYPFILAYCSSAIMLALIALCWSGWIFCFIPAFPLTIRVSLTLISVSLFIASTIIFMISFIGRKNISMASLYTIVLLITVNFISSLLTIIVTYGVNTFWIDRIFEFSLLGTLFAILITAFLAERKGNEAARYYLFVWSVPIGAALMHELFGMGTALNSSNLLEIAPAMIIALETAMSALAVSWRIGQLRDERDAARARQIQLKRLAETDSLTGLLNRRAFLEKAREGDQFKQLILIDIDNFKAINDAYGHDVGDKVIVSVAQTLSRTCAANHLIGRMGGEEFGIIAPDIAPMLAQRLCDSIRVSSTLGVPHVTVSAGVAIGTINSAEDWHQLYTAADGALYDAKRSGRNRVCESVREAA